MQCGQDLMLAEHLPFQVLLLPILVHEDSNLQPMVSRQYVVHQCGFACKVHAAFEDLPETSVMAIL